MIRDPHRPAEVTDRGKPLLSPTKKAVIGLFVIALGVAVTLDDRPVAAPELGWPLIAIGFGVIFWAFVRRRDEEDVEDQFAAVDERWEEIEAGMRAAEERGESVVRYLQAQGFKQFEVRQHALRRYRGEDEESHDDPAAGPEPKNTSKAYLPRSHGPGSGPSGPGWLPKS